jgi:hypothetical protein
LETSVVPRYFFHTANGQYVADEQGTELANQGEARVEAVKLVAELLLNVPEQFWETGMLSLCVSNADRLTLFTIDVAATDAAAAQPIYQKPLG